MHRLSWWTVLAASCGLSFGADTARSQQGSGNAPAAGPRTARLYWPFAPGETWRITRSWGVRGAHQYFALDLQRDDGSGRPLRVVTQGSDVRSAWSGRVIKVVNPSGDALDRGYGRHVDIDHGNGYGTRYAHFDQILVKEGQEIKLHAVIGKAGNTGDSTGAHLHFEVRKTTAKGLDGLVDPSPLLRPELPGRETLRGISLAVTPGGVPVRYDVSAIHADDRQALADDIARMLKEAFGKLPKKDQDPPAPAPKEPPPAPPVVAPKKKEAENVASLTFESITVVQPAGLPAQRWEDGLGGKGITFGTVGNQDSYVTVQRHPGFPNAAYTPEGIAGVLRRFAWQGARTSAVKVGKNALPGLQLAGAGGRTAVLFSHGGAVYMIVSRGQEDVFWRVVQSVEGVKKK